MLYPNAGISCQAHIASIPNPNNAVFWVRGPATAWSDPLLQNADGRPLWRSLFVYVSRLSCPSLGTLTPHPSPLTPPFEKRPRRHACRNGQQENKNVCVCVCVCARLRVVDKVMRARQRSNWGFPRGARPVSRGGVHAAASARSTATSILNVRVREPFYLVSYYRTHANPFGPMSVQLHYSRC